MQAALSRPRFVMPSLRRAGALATATLALGGFALGWWQMREFEARPLTLAGVALPSSGDPEPFVRELAEQWHQTEISVDAGSQIVRAPRSELGGTLDEERSIGELRRARGIAPVWERAWAFASGEGSEFHWHRSVREDETTAFAEELRRRTVVDAEPQGRDGSGGRPGTSLNLVGTTRALASAIRNDRMLVVLPVRRLAPPTRPNQDERTARFTEIVSAHETRYSPGGAMAGRARNVELAARFLDGSLIAPGQELSFNEVVGERSFERGFAPAIELARGGRRTEGIGGGVCQVAATLHAAAFFAGFEVPEQHPHTRNSTYIPAGLDSAVSWPNKDLRVRNPHSFPIRLRATAYRGTLRIELMGAERAPRVEWNTRIVRRMRRSTEREVDRGLPLGSEEVLDEGEDGSIMERSRTVYWADGAVTQARRLRYPMVTRLLRVGPQAIAETGQ